MHQQWAADRPGGVPTTTGPAKALTSDHRRHSRLGNPGPPVSSPPAPGPRGCGTAASNRRGSITLHCITCCMTIGVPKAAFQSTADMGWHAHLRAFLIVIGASLLSPRCTQLDGLCRAAHMLSDKQVGAEGVVDSGPVGRFGHRQCLRQCPLKRGIIPLVPARLQKCQQYASYCRGRTVAMASVQSSRGVDRGAVGSWAAKP
jgi:hypothetical protein